MPGQSPRIALLVSIGLLGLWLARALLIHVRRASQGERPAGSRSPWVPSTKETGTGFITVFLDTLGIGSFATTTTIFRTGRLVPDELIPGTLNVGHAVSGVLGAFIFIGLVPVASETLLPMILAAVVGAWLGSGLVARCLAIASDWAWAPLCSWPRPSCFSRSSSGSPGGGEALGLYGGRWVVAVLGSFVLGSLMTLGIGLYAPCMIMVSLLGMAPLAAFPITMGSGWPASDWARSSADWPLVYPVDNIGLE